MPPDPPPMLGSDTIAARAAASEQIFEARQQARDRVTEQFQTVDDPSEVPIRRQGERFGPSERFLQRAEPREAAARLDDEFPRQDLGPGSVRRTPDGQFAPTERTRRTAAAREIEATTPLGDVDPGGDLRAREGGGFGLARGPRRDLAARTLNPQFPAIDVGADDVTPTGDGGFGLDTSAERRAAAATLEADTQLDEVDPQSDLTREGDSFGLATGPRRELAARELDPQFPDVSLGADDVTPQQGGGFGLDQQAERRVAAADLEAQTPLDDVTAGDVERTDSGFELRDSVIDANRGLFR